MPSSSTRKQPRQQRARNTVKRILAAAAHLIGDEGLDALTTNRIADEAGVNIASLYQYFPNKEAIVSALLEAYFQEITRTLDVVLVSPATMPVGDAVRMWCHATLAFFREQPGMLTVLARQQADLQVMPSIRLMEYRMLEAMRRMLMPRRAEFEVPDMELAIRIAYTATSAVLMRHLLDPLPYHSDDQVTEALVRMVDGCFRPVPGSAASQAP